MEKKRSIGIRLNGLLVIILNWGLSFLALAMLQYLLSERGIIATNVYEIIKIHIKNSPHMSIIFALDFIALIVGTIAGVGVILLKEWGRVLTFVFAVAFIVVAPPFSLLFSYRIFWYFTRLKVKEQFK